MHQTNLPTTFSSSRIIAIGRIALAVSLFVLTITDPESIGFQVEPDDGIGLAYLIFALCVGLVAWKNWWLDYASQPVILFVDLLAFIALPSLVEPAHDGYRIAALTDATFILLFVALRWNWRLAGVTAIVLNLLNWMLTTFRPLTHIYANAPIAEAGSEYDYIRNVYFFLLVSLLIVWTGSRISWPRAASFDPFEARNDEDLLSQALDYATENARAVAGWICWQPVHDERAMLARRDLNGAIVSLPSDLCLTGKDVSAVRVGLFDINKRRYVILTPTGQAVARAWNPHRLIEESGYHQGALVPIFGASGNGVLVLSRPKTPSIDLLRYLETLAGEIGREFDRTYARRIAREEELGKLHNALARDLHDSVVQSIAGTRYWLKSLRETKPSAPEFETELDRLDQILSTEAKSLRKSISTLRERPQPARQGDFMRDLEGLASALANQWLVQVRVDADKSIDAVQPKLAFEIQQLVREGISNAVRHGHASIIKIDLEEIGGTLRVTIVDNGKGIIDYAQSGGPLTLKQRTLNLGGQFALDVSASGTAVIMTLPLGEK